MARAVMRWEDVAGWLDRLETEGDALVERTLREVADAPPDDDIRHEACEEGIAAAEVVACCAGAAPDDVPDALRSHVESCGVPEGERIALAFRAVERIGMQRDEHDEWLVDLHERLGALLTP